MVVDEIRKLFISRQRTEPKLFGKFYSDIDMVDFCLDYIKSGGNWLGWLNVFEVYEKTFGPFLLVIESIREQNLTSGYRLALEIWRHTQSFCLPVAKE